MRWSSSYTRAARRSNAAWSPPLQALNKPVTSADRGSAIAIPQKKVSRPWPVFPSTSARSGGGGTGNEDHTLGCHVGNGGSEPFCWTKRGAAKGDFERLYGNRPVHPDGCPAVGFGDVREHRCENRLARAGFMPGRGRRHPGAPVPRLDQGSRFGCRSPGLCTALCRDRRRVSRPRGRAESQPGNLRNGLCARSRDHPRLEGISRHSSTGIMKARLDYHDYFEMRRKPLPFAQEDVNLIYDGLKVPRVAPAAVAT